MARLRTVAPAPDVAVADAAARVRALTIVSLIVGFDQKPESHGGDWSTYYARSMAWHELAHGEHGHMHMSAAEVYEARLRLADRWGYPRRLVEHWVGVQLGTVPPPPRRPGGGWRGPRFLWDEELAGGPPPSD